jgi:hypothetical protein
MSELFRAPAFLDTTSRQQEAHVVAIIPQEGPVSAPLTGTANGNSEAGAFAAVPGKPIWVTLSGAWTGTVSVYRSVDGGATKLPLTVGGLPWGVFTGNANEEVAEETVSGATYYLEIALTAGSVTYRVQQ